MPQGSAACGGYRGMSRWPLLSSERVPTQGIFVISLGDAA